MSDIDSLTLALTQIHRMVWGPYSALNANHTAGEQAELELMYNILVICETALPQLTQ